MSNLVGTGLNQVPTNGMLGGLAYQDPNHASIKDLDLKNLSQINSEIADTAVDVFVYDTRKDSDGGAWRKRTQNTSWYNETLGTATRGSRKEFPAVAVIVMQEGTLTIYDGDDPDLPMWMVFTDNNDNGSQFASAKMLSCRTATSIFMLNGMLMCGGKGAYHDGATELNFLSDSAKKHMNNGYYYSTLNISQRETTGGYYTVTSGTPSTVSNLINDVAMTVLPNAPIDSATGLPIPTIAVATAAGVSVIKDDGTVVDITASAGSSYSSSKFISMSSDGLLVFPQHGSSATSGEYSLMTIPIPSSDRTTQTSSGSATDKYIFNDPTASFTSLPHGLGFSQNGALRIPGTQFLNYPNGLAILDENPTSLSKAMVAYIKFDHNTGWMQGDIKGAFLSDTDATNVSRSNLISNGTFDSNANGWSLLNGFSQSVSSSQLVLNRNGSTTDHGIETTITTVIGRQYVISVDVVSRQNSGTAQISVGTSSDTRNVLNFGTYNDNGTVTLNFIAASITSYVTLGVDSTSNGIVTYDNVYVTEAEEDRSVNNNPLQVFGTITKSAVATGAELVGYGGWSTSNYLEQPYNSDLNFGSGDFYVMGWAKPTNNTAGYVWERAQHQTASGYTEMFYHDSGQFRFYINGIGNVQGAAPLNTWTHFVCLRQDGVMYMFINGVRQSITVNNSTSLNNTSAKLRIGIRAYDITAPFYGEISLIRIGGGAPSTEQIKKIYEDEKVLFQENAKATLYGSSNAVTALTFDDTTELLHVGTSAGRSEFQGLRRINNTTTAVTTAISASNDLVAEQ